MTSGAFHTLPISGITVNRDARQRRELRNIDSLADSISRLGLINPIVVQRDGTLVAGERRFTAVQQLGWTSVPVHYTDEIDPIQLHLIELEENTKRLDITWPEECAAILEYERLQKSLDPEWTSKDTATALGVSESVVSQKKDVAVALERGDEKVLAAPKLSTAINIVTRQKERAKANAIQAIVGDSLPTAPIICGDFHEWSASYSGTPFNLIHCDFPYGINAHTHDQGFGSFQPLKQGNYDDSPDVYFSLLGALRDCMGNVVAESAHLIFWFSMDYYAETHQLLRDMGWRVNPFPLVWHKSDNTGVLPDPQRGPRRTYETALFASRGDRPIVSAVANSFSHPGRDKTIHMSEKPKEMLRHFLRMVVDEHTIMLDPTCGSGNAVRVSQDLGAKTVLGIERDAEFHARAVEQFNEGKIDV